MKNRSAILWLLPIIGLVVLADEYLKFWALQRLPEEGSITPGIIFLAIHKNWGVAFDIPFKMSVIILISIAIGAALLYVAYRNWKAKPAVAFAAMMIVIGAMGNLYDRLAYGFTVDYIIILGRSAINISDLVIIAGVILLLVSSRVTHGVDNHAHSV